MAAATVLMVIPGQKFDFGNVKLASVVMKKVGNDLLLTLPDGAVYLLTGFFSPELSDNPPALVFADDVLTAQDPELSSALAVVSGGEETLLTDADSFFDSLEPTSAGFSDSVSSETVTPFDLVRGQDSQLGTFTFDQLIRGTQPGNSDFISSGAGSGDTATGGRDNGPGDVTAGPGNGSTGPSGGDSGSGSSQTGSTGGGSGSGGSGSSGAGGGSSGTGTGSGSGGGTGSNGGGSPGGDTTGAPGNHAPVAQDDSGSAVEDGGPVTLPGAALLANDIDQDAGDTKTLLSVDGTSRAGASVSLVDGNIVYDPGKLFQDLSLGETTTDTFAYTMVDSHGATSVAFVTMTITGTNDAPKVEAISVLADEDGPGVVIDATTVAFDPDALDTVTFKIDTTGTHGTVVDNGDGTFGYSAKGAFDYLAEGEVGTDTFRYTVTDNHGVSRTETVAVTITGENDAPEAFDMGLTAGEDGPGVVVDVAAGARDPDVSDVQAAAAAGSSELFYIADATNTLGSVTDNGDGTFTYSAAGSFDHLADGEVGSDSFTYLVTDSHGATITRTVSLTILGTNDAPTVQAVVLTATEDDAQIVIDPAGYSNDVDHGDSLTFSIDASGAIGLVTDNGDGTFGYSPQGAFDLLAQGETATDTFTYTVTDKLGLTATETVTVNVIGVNDAPTASAIEATATEDDNAVVIDVRGATFDPDNGEELAFIADVTDTRGLVTDNGDGSFLYSAQGAFDELAEGETATDSFTYAVTDILGESASQTVSLTVTGVNDAPRAEAIGVTADEDGPAILVDAAAVSHDVDHGDTLTYSVDTAGTLGRVVDNGDGTFGYSAAGAFDTLADGQTGIDTFTYTVTDSHGATGTQTVTVSVTGANDTPSVAALAAETSEDGPAVVIDAGAATFDPDTGDELSYIADVTDTRGSVTDNGDGTFDYSAAGAFDELADGETATDSFTYTVTDRLGASATETVSLTVTGVNDAPDAEAISAAANEDGPGIVIDAAAVSHDVDRGDTISFSVDTQGTLGTVTDNGDGTFGYSAEGSFDYLARGETATDTFFYTVTDSHGVSTTETVTVAVTGANDMPTQADGDVLKVDFMSFGEALNGALHVSDADASDQLTFTLTGIPAHGTLYHNGVEMARGEVFTATDLDAGSITYVHDGSSYQADHLGFEVSDGEAHVMVTLPIEVTNDIASVGQAVGFTIDGAAGSSAGWAVSDAGDVNGDGFGDVLVGAPGENSAYVVFGRAEGFGAVDFGDLGGAGFRLSGWSGDAGFAVSGAGDVNGDGYADLLVGAPGTGGAGASYLVFGSQGGSDVDLTDLAGSGYRLGGIVEGDAAGWSVSDAGDVNGDGLGDVIIGAKFGSFGLGQSYVVFGSHNAADVSLDSLDGSNGFVLDGGGLEFSGASVSSAGDVNGDGYGDLIVGAPGDAETAGRSYVVFGHAGDFSAQNHADLGLLDGHNGGFAILGSAAGDGVGSSVSAAGDLNGDGFGDLIVGGADGQAHVIYGKSTGFGTVNLADPASGSVLHAAPGTTLTVSAAGDVNGDGYDDLIVGAGSANDGTGQAYVVFGKAGTLGDVDLTSIDGEDGFRLNGSVPGDRAGGAVSGAGDVNGDGYDDLIVGAPGTSGAAVVFGSDFRDEGAEAASDGDDILVGSAGHDDLDGGAGRDVLRAGAGDDTLAYDATDAEIDGGSGIDTLVLTGGGQTLNLTQNHAIHNVERIDLTGTGANSLVLDAHGVLTLSDTSNTLRIDGDGGDRVSLGSGWEDLGTVVDGDTTYIRLGQGEARLEIDSEITRGLELDLNDLDDDGSTNHGGAHDRVGFSVSSAGDVNGDGYDDVIIGSDADQSYVVFGNAAGSIDVDLAHLGPSTGFVIAGPEGEGVGLSVSGAGDVNGDGYADLIVGASAADSDTGGAYVVYGKAGMGDVDLTALGADDGYRLTGAEGADAAGYAVAGAGDVNGDGLADLIVGAPYAEGDQSGSGRVYVVYGRNDGSVPSGGDLANLGAGDGFAVSGAREGDAAGWSVSGAGDFNRDGYDDVVIGAPGMDGSDGQAYVVFGTAAGARVDAAVLDGRNGFHIYGEAGAGGSAGFAVGGGGDFNGDGYGDIAIGAPDAGFGGRAYVVFGNAGIGGSLLDVHLDWLDGTTGFYVNGSGEDGAAGYSVSFAGDLNGDGYDDLVIGAPLVDKDATRHGEAYIVFGRAHAEGINGMDLASLDGADGIRLDGSQLPGDARAGFSVGGAGDFDGDGYDDLVIGGPRADVPTADPKHPLQDAGQTYLVLGDDFRGETSPVATSGDNDLIGTQGADAIDGGAGSDVVRTGAGDDVVVWDAVDRRVDGGNGVDTLVVGGAGSQADLTGNTRITGFERIDVTGTGDNTLTLGAADVLRLSQTGNSVTVDGDAGDRVIAGSGWTNQGEVSVGGETYVRYTQGNAELLVDADVNRTGIEADVALGGLHGTDGLTLQGAGFSVSDAGDVNGDGFADVIVGDPARNTAYLVFGKEGGFGDVDLTNLTAGQGFALTGGAGDDAGFAVSAAGDLNGDGYGDLLIGSPDSGADGQGRAYVVLGHGADTPFGDVSLSANTTLDGVAEFDGAGYSVSGAGDVNGDGLTDLIIGAPFANGSDSSSGQSYIVFGQAGGVPSSSLDWTNGFHVNGANSFDISGLSVAGAGDVNHDGYDDVVIGATGAEGGDGRAYVVYGKAGGFGDVDLHALGGQGFVLKGASNGGAGLSVSGADVNGDGYADLVVGSGDGKTYVVFGHSGAATDVDLSALNGSDGFRITGSEADLAGYAVSGAGDVNGDGYDDLVIGAPGADGGAGKAYVVFGKADGFGDVNLGALDSHTGFELNGSGAAGAGVSVSGAGDVNGDGYDDILIGSDGASQIVFGSDFRSEGAAVATDGNDILVGTSHMDILDGGAGSDVLRGGAGDDLLIFDAEDRLIDGGSGYDTLAIGGDGNVNLGEHRIEGIEHIDFTGNGNASVTASVQDILHLSDTTNTLQVDGQDGNQVNLGTGWVNHGDTNGDGYLELTQGNAQLQVAQDVGIGVTINLGELNGSNGGYQISGAGAGDTLGFSVNGAGDLNGDGFADIALGAPGEGGAGAAHVIYGQASAQGNLNVATLQSGSGITLEGHHAGDLAGDSVAGAGDVNDDGIADLIVGAGGRDAGGDSDAGAGVLVFGKDDGSLGDLNGETLDNVNNEEGLAIVADVQGGMLGASVAGAGDFNGDGKADIIVGAPFANGTGEAYVVFGSDTFDASGSGLLANELAPHAGVMFYGAEPDSLTGFSVSGIGDLNGDRFDDVAVGAPDAAASAGLIYVLFGRAAAYDGPVDLGSLDGTLGFTINGAHPGDFAGWSLAGGVDVNGDGRSDLIIGAYGADEGAGAAYIVFGRNEFGATLDLGSLEGDDGLKLAGGSNGGMAGFAVAGAGDTDGDGYGDVLVGAPLAGDGGKAYLVFGSDDLGDEINLSHLDLSKGLTMDGANPHDQAGYSVAGAGDVNGDGYDDVLIGAPSADPHGDESGQAYLVYGADFRGKTAETATEGSDILVGTAGSDVVDAGAGADVVHTGAGNDEIVVDGQDFRIDGGSGFDTLALDPDTTVLDFTALAPNSVTNIEKIDMGTSGSTLTVGLADVLDMSGSADQIFIDGGAGSTVKLEGGWTAEGTVSVGGIDYIDNTLDGAHLLVQDTVTTVAAMA